MFNKFMTFSSSWWLTAGLLLSLCASYIYFAFTGTPYEKWTNFLFHAQSGLAIYIGIIVNLIFASIRIILKRAKSERPSPEIIKGMDTYIEIPLTDSTSSDMIIEWMKKRRFSAKTKDNIANSLKARYSFVPGHILRTGIIIAMAALLFSAHIRIAEDKILHEGEEIMLLNKKITPLAIESDLPENFIQVGEKESLRLNNISAALLLSSKTYKVTGRFPVRIDGHYYRLTNIGFSQAFSARISKKEFSKKTDLNILPPGKSDTIILSPDKLQITFTLQPEKTIAKGLVTGKVYNLRSPSYNISVKKENKNIVENLIMKPPASAAFKNGSITLDAHSSFAKMQSVYDPALLWIYTGIVITLLGLILMLSRFFWYEKQMCAIFMDDRAVIGYREEFYKKWGIMKFHSWAEELKSGSNSY